MHTANHLAKPRRDHQLLVAIIFLAAVLRFYQLDSQSLWYDEGFSVALAKASWAEAIAWTAQDVHPPLYYLLLHLWIRLCGDHAFAVRTFSALCAIATLPLIYVMGKRILGQTVGLTAAFLATFSPLGLYYSRETRMYTLATFLTLLASYLLLRITAIPCPRKQRIFLWGAYLLTSLAAAYVHYFALLVLVAHALYFGVWWLSVGYPPSYLQEGLAVLLLGMAGYSPWVSVLVNRYLYDTGYWAASMPFLAALRRVLISLSVGETTPEHLAWPVTIGYLVLLLISAPQLRQAQTKSGARHTLLFLWMYLIVPALLIAFLYSHKPRISPRHSMLLSPAFLLLLSTTLVQFAASKFVVSASELRGSASSAATVIRQAISLLVAFTAICFVLATSGYAAYNLFFNSAMRRPDFRGAVSYIREHRKPDEAVLLISGHMFPVFDYYCPGCERYPIPDDPLLRVDHMVTLQVIEQLSAITTGKSGVWLLLWQDHVVDPHHFVSDLLLRQGTELRVPSFHGVGLRHIQLSPAAKFVWESNVVMLVNARWRHGITLLEARVNRLTFHHGDTLQLTLFWRADNPISESYTVFTHVQRLEARTQHDGYPANDSRPTYTWRPGEVIEDRHMIEIPSWLPPGEYNLIVGLYNRFVEGMPRLGVLDELGNEKDCLVVLTQVNILPDRS
nr:glycosyltransferase family 39 protein [Chloroflexota bacterium]